MKQECFIEFQGLQISYDDIIKKVKEQWVSVGHKVKEIKSLKVYFKVEDKTAYCVVNETEKIDIVLEE